jgi:hypothetical protein
MSNERSPRPVCSTTIGISGDMVSPCGMVQPTGCPS